MLELRKDAQAKKVVDVRDIELMDIKSSRDQIKVGEGLRKGVLGFFF